jgi:hypothetical protein
VNHARRDLCGGCSAMGIPTATWWKIHEGYPFTNLSPGEETSFSCMFEVPTNECCEVEVIVFGKTVWFVYGSQESRPVQWRASAISLPTTGQAAGN